MVMRYWGLLAGKLAAGGLMLWAVWAAMAHFFPPPASIPYIRDPFLHDLPYTLRVFGFGLLAVGVIALAILDQRYRCRVCLRRLRMPVETGSWKNTLLFGRPQMEWICPYGHGTLRVPELQITGIEGSDWQPHEDIWTELEHYEQSSK